MSRFQREAEVLASLNHPNIVAIYSVEEIEGLSIITMELVEGRPLAHLIPTAGLPLARLLKIGIPVADALAAAHQKGITHRDLKPANIMIGTGEHDGRAKVLEASVPRPKRRILPARDDKRRRGLDVLRRDSKNRNSLE